jgi:hypothetical protein
MEGRPTPLQVLAALLVRVGGNDHDADSYNDDQGDYQERFHWGLSLEDRR